MFVAVGQSDWILRILLIHRVVMALGSEVSENSTKNASQKVKKCPANTVNDKCGGDSVSKGKLEHALSYVTYLKR